MSRAIIHISTAGLGQTLADILCLDACLREGMQVLYLDVSPILGLKSQQHDSRYQNLIIYVQSKQELSNLLRNYDSKNAILNIQMAPNKTTVSLIKELQKKDFVKIFFDVGTLPESNVRSWLRKIKFLFKPFVLQPDYVFRSGLRSYLSFSSTTKVLSINYADYDLYLAKKNQIHTPMQLENDKYIVFLDQYLPGHIDFVQLGGVGMDVERYYKSISNFLLQYAKRNQCRVVIAAHPKADFKNYVPSEVLVYKNQTFDLIAKAEVVFAHYSTAVSYAVLFNRPLVFLINNCILNSPLRKILLKQIKGFSDFFSAPLLNCDGLLSEFSVGFNKKIYDKYKFNYLTTYETQSHISERYVIKYLNEIFNTLAQGELNE